MRGKPKKTPRQKDLTSDYMSGSLDEDRVEQQQRFTHRSRHGQRDKMLKTAALQFDQADLNTLPTGQVVQIHSLYCEVKVESRSYLCVVRKTLTKVHGDVVVGDRVRFRVADEQAQPGSPQGVIEQILPRETMLTRADSFKARTSHPIVANAQQVLIVAAVREPRPKWGLIDRMIVSAEAGQLRPVICLNKVDLADESNDEIDHYASLGYQTLRTSVQTQQGIEELRSILKDRETVLAGHSGVGKSSLIRAVQPGLDIRIGEVSQVTQKGRHTTTSARRYPMPMGGAVIDTPGVKLFGLWNVTPEKLIDHFPDVAAETAPPWRVASYERILESLTK